VRSNIKHERLTSCLRARVEYSRQCVCYDDSLTCVKDVASLTEKGTSRTLASVRANKVLPTLGSEHIILLAREWRTRPSWTSVYRTMLAEVRSADWHRTSPGHCSSQMLAGVDEKKEAWLSGVCAAAEHELLKHPDMLREQISGVRM